MARPVRYKIVGLLFSGTVINYIDRVNISVAAPVIMDASGWSKSELGLVFSAFLVGYSVLQLPGGLVADRWSARKVLALAFCGFSLFTALTPRPFPPFGCCSVRAFWLACLSPSPFRRLLLSMPAGFRGPSLAARRP